MFFIDQYSLTERKQIYDNIKTQIHNHKLLAIIVNIYEQQKSIKLLVNQNCTASELIIYVRRKFQLPAISYYIFAQRNISVKPTLLACNCYIRELLTAEDNFRYINFLQQDSFGSLIALTDSTGNNI